MTPSLWKTILKRFYGIEELDEYREAQINAIGNRLYVVNFTFNLLSSFVAILFVDKHLEAAFYGLLFSNFAVFFLSNSYLLYKLQSLKLNTVDVEEDEYAVKLAKLKKQCLLGGMFFGTFMHLWNNVDLGTWQFKETLTHWWFILVSLFVGIFFGTSMYFFGKHNIKKD